jgi:hypothetical protein
MNFISLNYLVGVPFHLLKHVTFFFFEGLKHLIMIIQFAVVTSNHFPVAMLRVHCSLNEVGTLLIMIIQFAVVTSNHFPVAMLRVQRKQPNLIPPNEVGTP